MLFRRARETRCALTLGVLAALGSLPQTTNAQPVNDACSAAIPIGDGSISIDTTGATTDGPSPCGSIGSDIWFSYTATCTGNLVVSTCNMANYDTAIAVYPDGVCPPTFGSQLGCNDDSAGCAGLSSLLSVAVPIGMPVLIQMGGFAGNTGTATLSVDCVLPGAGACCFADDSCTSVLQTECEMNGGTFKGEGVPCTPSPCTASNGADVIYTDIQSISNWGALGGIRAYSLGSSTCNIGDQNLLWGGVTPLLAMNAYRLHGGRLEQIGMSWVKNGTGAAAGNGCGLPCNGQGGSVLGSGCLDVYSSGFNGIHSILGPRSTVNPLTGDYPGVTGTGTSIIDRRLQIAQSDLTQPGALYFAEGQYIAPDDAAADNAMNNASYKRVTVNASFDLTPVGAMQVTVPAIYAWRDHGNGVDTPDNSVNIVTVDVPNEGRYHVAAKVASSGGGSWHYEYAVRNFNSHRACGSFTVPFPAGTIVTNVGFHDVDYHTGEPYDNTDWGNVVGATFVTWSTPNPTNPNTNALRWGTMYNFWFDADLPPTTGDVTLGLFTPVPGEPDSVVATLEVPGAEPAGVPTVSQWGLVVMTMLLMTAGTVIARRGQGAEV